ncbi:uncharacterized protein LOC135810873 [Sycon ciliatum]|uniref:uncharacterized protein LOC135810873 n=1 Tax=Sycon ciliatum TaxID=27933 RepID=UPI0020ADE99A
MSSVHIRCGNCNTVLVVPPGHAGVISCGACKTNLQVSAPANPPGYNAVPANVTVATSSAPCPGTTTIVTTHGGCHRCGGPMGPERWTLTAWLLCFFFFPWNFCIPGCQPSEAYCSSCGHCQHYDL